MKEYVSMAPSGTYGIVMDVKVSSCREVAREAYSGRNQTAAQDDGEDHKRKKEGLIEQLTDSLSNVLLGEKFLSTS